MSFVVDAAARQVIKGEFARDMANHQRIQGKLPTPGENAQIVARQFEQWEQKWADEARRLKPAPTKIDERPKGKRVADAVAAKLSADRDDGMTYRLVREDDLPAPRIVTLDPRSAIFAERLEARVQLLLTGEYPDGSRTAISIRERGALGEPSWFERVIAARRTHMHAHTTKDDDMRKRAVAELIQVCEDSNRVFGDWKKPPARAVMFT